MNRRDYPIDIRINSRRITRAVIDSHYEKKHSSSITDELIIRLVKQLDGGVFPVHDRDEPYEYFVTDGLKLDGKYYKLIWLLEDHQLFIGVVNAYRRK